MSDTTTPDDWRKAWAPGRGAPDDPTDPDSVAQWLETVDDPYVALRAHPDWEHIAGIGAAVYSNEEGLMALLKNKLPKEGASTRFIVVEGYPFIALIDYLREEYEKKHGKVDKLDPNS